MDNKAIFDRTIKGEQELRSKPASLPEDVRRALLMVDGIATFGEISKRVAPSLRYNLAEMFEQLEKGGFIQDKTRIANIPRMAVPPKMSVPFKKQADENHSELDFTSAFRASTPERMAVEAARAQAEKLKAETEAKVQAEAEAKQEIEAAKLMAQREADAVRHKAEQEVARVRAELEAVKAKAEADANAREEAELAKQQAAAEARAREEVERRAREAAEAVRMKAEQEAARARAELEAARAAAKAEAGSRKEVEQRAREEVEAARLKAQREAEAAHLKAKQEAAKVREAAELAKQQTAAEAKVREDAERQAKKEAEAARLKAEREAAHARAELEAARAKAEAEAHARAEVEQKARHEAELAREEAARLKAEVDAKYEAEIARLKAEQEAAKAREEAEVNVAAASLKAQQEAEARLLKSAQDGAREAVRQGSVAASAARSSSATVLFFDVVGYTKLPVNKQIEIKTQFNLLLSDCLKAQEDGERIILDTGDGAAIGFLQHPEDALEVAREFRRALMGNQYKDRPDLKVRMGIHLGPINVVKDMTGRSNMVGDGINDAQRVMSFAGTNQIYISRPYYDFVSRLADEYADLFQYRGSQIDKHGREHQVYELVDVAAPVAEAVLPQAGKPDAAIKLEPFDIELPEAAVSPVAAMNEEPEMPPDDLDLIRDIRQFILPEKTTPTVVVQKQSTPEALPFEVAKPVAEVRMPSGEDVAKFAADQSRIWAEAEQRAAEIANAERAAQSLSKGSRQKAADRKSVLISRLPRGKVAAGFFVLLLIALFAVPYVLPMQGYATRIEQLLAARLQQPVHIGHMAARLLPAPRFDLSDVSIGGANQIQARQARVNFAWSALYASNKPINSIQLDGVQVNGAALQQVSAWVQQIAADSRYPVAGVELNQGRLEADGFQLSGVGGELGFNQAGKLAHAKLYAEENKYVLDINATPENKLQVSITIRGSALPLLPDWTFDELNAKGELTGDELVITDLSGRIMGGMLLGDARINWRSGWHAQGTLVARSITVGNLNKMLSGDMEGKASFRMQSASLSRLAETAIMDGTFVIREGVINGVNVVETARLRSSKNLPGGRTHFDELSGVLSYADDAYHFSQIKMSAGVLNATGTLDIVKQQLSGRILADMAMRAGTGAVVLQVGGTADNPTLRAVR
jgi:hypothetical protein